MNPNFSNITHQLKKNSYSYNRNGIQQIHYKLNSSVTGKYSNPSYISQFVEFLIRHIFVNNISTESGNRFNNLNIYMLYMVYILKTYEFPEFNDANIFDINYDCYWKGLFGEIMTSCNEEYSSCRFDLLRYLYIYNLICNNKFII